MNLINILADTICSGESLKIFSFINKIINLVKIVIPIIMVVMGAIDLTKAVTAQKDDEIKKAQGTLIKRFIYGVLIFFVPAIVSLVIGLVDNNDLGKEGGVDSNSKCWNCALNGGDSCDNK